MAEGQVSGTWSVTKRLMSGLTLQEADAIVQGALAKARELKCKPMTVAVVDAGGAAIVMKRERSSSMSNNQDLQNVIGGSTNV